ncbi:VOC family protein [Hymenobacter sp. YC55]|uniref:VOC family protein n=1 Tax=Hymenobacter sp. YC55 TaxID=3034019 RepID=UPI0023F8049E|nr:VOC family protein [Hymenobacter sp. YC55]MDF7813818.1 VOC family protein [Hymenobacter sp. YC55]
MPHSIPYKLAFHGSRPDLDCLQAFVTTVLGAQRVHEEPGLAACQLPSGSLLELYGPGACYPPHLFEHSPLVASFPVANLKLAVEQAQVAGLHVVAGPEEVCSGLRYCHLQLPGGWVIGLYQEGLAALAVLDNDGA